MRARDRATSGLGVLVVATLALPVVGIATWSLASWLTGMTPTAWGEVLEELRLPTDLHLHPGDVSVADWMQLFVLVLVLGILLWLALRSHHLAADRRRVKHYHAWRVIGDAQGKAGNGGRAIALEDLDADGVSLAGVDLSGGAYLAGVELPGARLWRANLAHAILWDADLEQATLQEARLEQASLQDANLRGANLSGANLKGANLEGADLTGANLQDADLVGATLAGAILVDAELEGANLRLANLCGANLENVSPLGVDVTGANLDGALGWAGGVLAS